MWLWGWMTEVGRIGGGGGVLVQVVLIVVGRWRSCVLGGRLVGERLDR